MQKTLKIEELSYPDFVAFLRQKNSPPGGIATVLRTAKLAEMTKESFLLDLACSTGLSSREIVKTLGCRAKGIDLSKDAVAIATKEAKDSDLTHLIEYQVSQAENLPFDENMFSHVLSGCNFSFIQERDKALRECHRVLKKSGKLCVANFYYSSSPPALLLEQVEKAINFRPESHWSREWWLQFFEQEFNLQIEEKHDLAVQKDSEIEESIVREVYQNSHLRNFSDEIKRQCFERLLWIRSILNEHRNYQKFNITIWTSRD